MSRKHPELLTAYAQVVITVVFLGGYFWVLGLFVLGRAAVDPNSKDMVTALLGVLTASVVAILSYWFARQRGKEESHVGQVIVERVRESVVSGGEVGAGGSGAAEHVAPWLLDRERAGEGEGGGRAGGSAKAED